MICQYTTNASQSIKAIWCCLSYCVHNLLEDLKEFELGDLLVVVFVDSTNEFLDITLIHSSSGSKLLEGISDHISQLVKVEGVAFVYIVLVKDGINGLSKLIVCGLCHIKLLLLILEVRGGFQQAFAVIFYQSFHSINVLNDHSCIFFIIIFHTMDKTRTRFRSTKITKKLEPLKIQESSFNEKFENNLNDIVVDFNDEERRTDQDASDTSTIKKGISPEGNQTVEMSSEQPIGSSISIANNELRVPYEFIGVSSPKLHTIILPHFAFKSITFIMSVLMLLLFISFFIAHEIRPKNDNSWGCLLFQAQNKFYPRLKLNYEFWRVAVSGVFHSNFSHLILNLVGIQLYGYWVEWYIGHLKFMGMILISIVNAHFLSCLTNRFTVSTSASGILYAILSIKILFFIKYRHYEPLDTKRIALYGLLGLIFGMNIIVLFVGGNVDVGGHVGGLITGIMYGLIFYEFQQQTKKTKIFKICMCVALAVVSAVFVAACFAIEDQEIVNTNQYIDSVCRS